METAPEFVRLQTAIHRIAVNNEPWFMQSESMSSLRDLATLAAENSSPVLLLGETGIGKGMLARWIHQHSHFSAAQFVEVNCSALRGELLASELFGHIKGAFTSATQNQQGLLELADGGTLFLDEIADMDPAVQTQFLKVIEEKQYRRLGEVRMRTSNFRLICATNRNLKEDTNAGRFRKDLFFRIHIFPIEIPPLREHPEDIPGLARYLLHRLGAGKIELPASIAKHFAAYDWPGNIREMRNLLERAMLLARGCDFSLEHFPELPQMSHPEPRVTTFPAAGQEPKPPGIDDERSAGMILEALLESSGGLTRTEISSLFGHHKFAQDITRVLNLLAQRGIVRSHKTPTAGRPIERWFAVCT